MVAPSPEFSALRSTLHAADLTNAVTTQRIDDFVRAHPDGTPFHLTGWSRAVAKGCGQISHYLIAEDETGTIVGVLPLTEVHSPLFGRALVSSGFAVGGGAIATAPVIANHLIERAVMLAQRLSCPSVELRGGALPQIGWHYDTTTYTGFVRDLAADDEAELLAIPRKQRAEVRKALTFALDVETGTSARYLRDHYEVYATSVRNLGTPVFPRSLFSAVTDEFGDDADILTIKRGGTAIASVLSLYFNGTVMPYWGGGTKAARQWRANDLMYFALMRHAHRRGCQRFDFGRSKTGTGAAQFKHNWGFPAIPLSYATHVATGAATRQINPLDPRYQRHVRLWQNLPLWAANRLGPLIARGLG